MINPDELRTVTGLIGADAIFGSAVLANMRRFIYKIRVTNEFAGPNLITLGKRENGAGATTPIDYFHLAVQYEQQDDPEVLLEESVPLYIVEGAGAIGASNVWAAAGGGAASAYLTLWYADAPAM